MYLKINMDYNQSDNESFVDFDAEEDNNNDNVEATPKVED